MKSKHNKCKPCDVCGKYFNSNKSLTAHQQKEQKNREDSRKRSFVWSESMFDDCL